VRGGNGGITSDGRYCGSGGGGGVIELNSFERVNVSAQPDLTGGDGIEAGKPGILRYSSKF